PALATAVVKPERNTTYELGVKTNLFDRRLIFNADLFDTSVQDFQANVVDTGPGALRGYLANIEEVRVKGAELDSSFLLTDHFKAHVNAAYNDGEYVFYHNGPCPIEAIGTSTTICDLSGKRMSALPRWVGTLGGEYDHPLSFGRISGEGYFHAEVASRSWTYGDPSDSQYTAIGGYTTVNANLGFREISHWEFFIWARNLLNKDYLQNLTVQAGNSGLIVGTPNDPRSFGLTVRATF
ncbi:MAG TPA: TonB-dependent receptor, partial [Steroidobacteraceae bacterium]|nr:TonB-dependent receptor [Steroidobacteraceae bacterium]